VFSSFGFKWPVQLNKLFAASSMSSFNDQLMAPECSIGTWSFEMKCVALLAVSRGGLLALLLANGRQPLLLLLRSRSLSLLLSLSLSLLRAPVLARLCEAKYDTGCPLTMRLLSTACTLWCGAAGGT
jgi:hypothetical protein